MASPTITPSYGPITSAGTVTSYLPLSSAWSAPTDCSSLFLSNVLSPNQLYLNDPKYPNVVVGAPTCLPPQMSTWWYNTPNTVAPTVFSLGGYSFFCPEAYSTVYSTEISLTTTIGCCPSNYNWLSTLLPAGQVPQCISILPSGNVTFARTNTGPNNFNNGFTVTSSSLSAPFTVRGVQVNGYIFSEPSQAAAATTFSAAAESSTATSTTDTGSSISSSTGTTSPTATTSPGLSQGAKIGVGVGVTLGVIIFASLLAALLLFRRKRRQSDETEPFTKPELSGESPVSELDAEKRHELESVRLARYEMGASPNDRPAAVELA